MKTDKLWISSTVRRQGDADEILRDFADRNGITGRDSQYLRLLTEETLGMANQLLKDFDGEIWLETIPSGYEINLEADVRESGAEKASPAVPPAGFMARIAELMNCSYVFEHVAEMPEDLAGMLPDYMSYGIRQEDESPAWAGRWSLSAWRFSLQERQKADPGAALVLAELEKSIVARLADEVTVGIRGHRVRLVITRKLS